MLTLTFDIHINSVLSVYEYIITFDREVQSIWKRKHSFATFLWVLVSCTFNFGQMGEPDHIS